jgi:hypothetical protein
MLLLRVANVNPASVKIHTDRVLYSSIGVFIVLYFAYATAGAAAFVDASSDYRHPWWRFLVGPPVALAVIAFDRAVVGRVAVNLTDPGDPDPAKLLQRRAKAIYLGRIFIALLFAVVITEPLMLARYKPEIDAYLNRLHSQELGQSESSGAIAAYQRQIAALKQRDGADDKAVADLHALAAAKRDEAAKLYAAALADSDGNGVTHRAGCPRGGYCDSLVQRSRTLDAEASAVDGQAQQMLASQGPARQARAGQQVDLERRIAEQRQAILTAIDADAGFGARTKAMWHLASADFWGVGVFYLGITLLLVLLDGAAIALKLASHGNTYERAEAREARRIEYEAIARHEHDLRLARATADATGEATLDIATNGIRTAGQEQRLFDSATEAARTQLAAAVDRCLVTGEFDPSR